VLDKWMRKGIAQWFDQWKNEHVWIKSFRKLCFNALVRDEPRLCSALSNSNFFAFVLHRLDIPRLPSCFDSALIRLDRRRLDRIALNRSE
jgi:hypothetical protein